MQLEINFNPIVTEFLKKGAEIRFKLIFDTSLTQQKLDLTRHHNGAKDFLKKNQIQKSKSKSKFKLFHNFIKYS